jgi:hypothetical protein
LGLIVGRRVLVTSDVDLVLVVVRDVHVAARAVKRRRSRPRGEFGHLVRIVLVGLVAAKQRSRDKVWSRVSRHEGLLLGVPTVTVLVLRRDERKSRNSISM